MRRIILSLLLAVVCSMPSLVAPRPSYSLDQPVIMIFGQKEFPESLSRNSRVFKQTLAEITDILIQEYDLEVKDEVAASADTYEDRGGRRNKAEIAEIAKEADCDVAVIFQVTPWVKEVRGFKKVESQITLDAFFVDKSGRKIGMVDVKSDIAVKIETPFKKPQIMDAAAESTKDIAAQAADELGQQILARMEKREEIGGIYTLVFKKFKTKEVEDSLDAFTTIDGYTSHRQTKKSARKAKVEYRSSADMSTLTSEFDLIFKDLGYYVNTSTHGSNITFTKSRIRRSRR